MLRNTLTYAVRRLLAHPWRTCATVGTLSVAIGVGTAMFTVADALVFRSVPFPKSHELALLSLQRQGFGPYVVARSVYAAWKSIGAFAAVEAAVTGSVLLENDHAVRVMATVSPGLFALLGDVRPRIGRLFTPADALPGADAQVLIGEDVWRALYGSDPGIIGRSIMVDNEQVVVVGVLPATFRFPTWNTVIWRAADFTGPQADPWAGRPVVYVRFAANVPVSQALQAATAAARHVEARREGWRAHAAPLADVMSDRYYLRSVPLLSGGVALLCTALAWMSTDHSWPNPS